MNPRIDLKFTGYYVIIILINFIFKEMNVPIYTFDNFRIMLPNIM